jgi:hypothetical protein
VATVLGRLFVPERRNMRMPEKLQASIRSGVSSRPALNELEVPDDVEPLLSTNAARQFVQTRRSSVRGTARYGFSEVPVDEEEQLVIELYMSLLDFSLKNQWGNRCNSVTEAVTRLRGLGLEPALLVVPESVLPDICGPDFDPKWASQMMKAQGYVATVDDMQVMTADLPPGAALVSTHPEFAGLYTRVGDYLGLMIQRADRAIMVVGDGVA